MAAVSHRQVIGFLWKYARKRRTRLVVILLTSITSATLFLIQPVFYRHIIEIIAAHRPDSVTFWRLILLVLGGVSCAAVAFIAEQFGALLLGRLEANIMREVHSDVFAVTQRHATNFHASSFSGATARKIGRGADAIEIIFDRISFNFVPTIIMLIGFTIALSFFAPMIGLAMLGGTVLYIVGACIMNLFLSKKFAWFDAQDSLVNANLVDVVMGNSLVKLFAAEEREDARHSALLREAERRRITVFGFSTSVSLVQFFSILCIELSSYLLGIWLWYHGAFSAGDFIVLTFYIGHLWGRLWDIGRNLRDYMKNIAHCEEMLALVQHNDAILDQPNARPLIVSRGEIAFRDVCFRYSKHSRMVLDRLSITIAPGEKVALVGPSGHGKSSIVKVLLRLYDLAGGTILIDGQDIAHVTQQSLRSAIALVPQDPILFHRSILENIAYGMPDAPYEDIVRAAELAHADAFIDALMDGYETLVGERGVKLSGGERQRIALARAILADRPILVLDEATSSLDAESEMYIQEALDTLMRGKTSIVIAHRLSTIKKVDRILVVDKGVIVEEGTHAELIKKDSGLYRHFYDLQSGGFLGE